MKNKILKFSLIGLLPASLSLGVLFGVPGLAIDEVNGYASTSISKMDIDLNDTSPEDIRSYYSALNLLGDDEKTGNNLLKNLKPILKENQIYYSYPHDSTWRMYEITDRDWEKSPASQIDSDGNGHYDSATNTIQDYVFQKEGVDPYIHALYNDRNQENLTTAWSNHTQGARGINREHIWPKSHGFEDKDEASAGSRGDPMNLWAGDGYTNNIHNNHYYGYVDKTKTYVCTNQKPGFEYTGLNYRGISLTAGEGTVFEPQDSDKGDIARAVFYMVARYNNLANETTGIDVDDPNLYLDNIPNETTGTSTYDTPYSLGVLSDLIEWNKIDPPDEYEKHRNNLLYNNFTNNRNPFIDFPEWVDICFDPNATGYADPVSDPLFGEGTESKVLVDIQVTTNPSKTIYNEGETFSTDGMIVKAIYHDGSSETITNYEVSPAEPLIAGTESVLITYNNRKCSVPITVVSKSSTITRFFEKVYSDLKSGSYLITCDALGVAWKTGKTGNANVLNIEFDDNDNIIYSDELENAMFAFDISDGSILAPNKMYIYNNSESTGVLNSATPMSNNIELSAGNLSISGENTSLYCNSNNEKPTFNFYKSKADSYYSTNIYRLVEVAEDVVHPESIVLSDSSLTLEIDDSTTLSATVLPEDTTIKGVTWASDNEEVATVEQNGRVVAHKSGTAHITATSKDVSTVIGSCTVTVPQPIVLDSISLSGTYKTEYFIGDKFSSEGIVVTANYKQGEEVTKTENVTEYAEFSGFDSDTTGNKTITVSYGDLKTTYTVTVSEVAIDENTVNIISSLLGYSNKEKVTEIKQENYTITFNGGKSATKYYDAGSAIRVYSGGSFTISGPYKITKVSFDLTDTETNTFSVDKGTCDASTGQWSSETGEDKVTFTIGGTSGHKRLAGIHIQFDPAKETTKELVSITLSGTYQTEFDKKDVFNSDGLVVTANYNHGPSVAVTSYTLSGYDMDVGGKQTVIVSYTEDGITKENSYEITVNETKKLESITLSGNHKTEFFVGDNFTRSGLVVTAHYDDGTEAKVTPKSVSGYKMSVVSDNQVITVKYVENDITVTATYSIKVKDILPESLALTNIEKTSYVVDDDFNDNLTATVTYNNGDTATVTPTNIEGYNMSSVGEQEVTVSYTEKGTTVSNTYKITVIKKAPVSLAISGDFKKNFNVGDTFDHNNLTATVTYNDGSSEDVTSNVSFSNPNMLTSGTQEVTVTYTFEGKSVTAKYNININALVLSIRIELEEPNASKIPFAKYKANDIVNAKVIAKLSDNTESDVTEYATKDFSIKGLMLGEQTISASYNGASAELTFKVTNEGSEQYVGYNNNQSVNQVYRAETQTFNATPIDQAVAYAEYFEKQTGNGEYSEQVIREAWDNLKAEYNFMVNDSKDTFCSQVTSNEVIKNAIKHYKSICNVYSIDDQFMQDSSGQKIVVPGSSDSTKVVIYSVAGVGVVLVLVAIAVLSVLKKRKKAKMNK